MVVGEAAGHEGDHRPLDHRGVVLGQPFVVAHGAPAAVDPGERALHATWGRVRRSLLHVRGGRLLFEEIPSEAHGTPVHEVGANLYRPKFDDRPLGVRVRVGTCEAVPRMISSRIRPS